MLRVNLISVFMVDEIRRIACESLIPYLQQNKDKLQEEIKQKIKDKQALLKRKLGSSDKVHSESGYSKPEASPREGMSDKEV